MRIASRGGGGNNATRRPLPAGKSTRRRHETDTDQGLGFRGTTAVPADSVESQESHRIVVTLVQKASDGADALQLAEFIVSAWQAIEASLSPIIGQRSVAILYKRSFYLASRKHSWLMNMHEGMRTTMNLEALKADLVEHTNFEIAAAAGAALQMFYEVLTNLVGASLTEKLLQSVWADLLPAPTQDNSA